MTTNSQYIRALPIIIANIQFVRSYAILRFLYYRYVVKNYNFNKVVGDFTSMIILHFFFLYSELVFLLTSSNLFSNALLAPRDFHVEAASTSFCIFLFSMQQ